MIYCNFPVVLQTLSLSSLTIRIVVKEGNFMVDFGLWGPTVVGSRAIRYPIAKLYSL